MIQLRLPFPEWSPAARARAKQEAWAKHIADRYPITPQEERSLPPNVRLARFVPLAECEICAFACEDHRLSELSVTLVCVKDHIKTQLPKEQL